MKIAIVEKSSGQVVETYEADQIDSSSARRSWLRAEPICAHVEVPEGLDLDCLSATWVDEVTEPELIPAHYEIRESGEKKSEKRKRAREQKLQEIRNLRKDKLQRVDELVNAFILDQTSVTKQQIADYRTALLDVTEPYKNQNGSANSQLDSVNVSAFEWPEEPGQG